MSYLNCVARQMFSSMLAVAAVMSSSLASSFFSSERKHRRAASRLSGNRVGRSLRLGTATSYRSPV